MTKRVLVGIAGGSGSGKTTVAKLLAEALSPLNVVVLSQDHYYRDQSHLSPDERDDVNFDHPSVIDQACLYEQVMALVDGKSISRPSYDFASHTRTQKVEHMASGDVIILDGIFALNFSQLLDRYDLKVFVDVPSDLRFIRRQRRDVTQRGRDFESVTEQYLSSVRPMHYQFVEPTKQHADIVLPWRERSDVEITRLAQKVSELVH